MITDYHANYYAHELNRVGGTGVDRLGRALFDACVDLNPHQIEAALFALRSPFQGACYLLTRLALARPLRLVLYSVNPGPNADGTSWSSVLHRFANSGHWNFPKSLTCPLLYWMQKPIGINKSLVFQTHLEIGESLFAPCTLPLVGRKKSERLPGTLWLLMKLTSSVMPTGKATG